MRERKISIYDLEYTYNLNPAEISRLKHNHNFTLKMINRLCQIFHCQPSDIMVYREYEPFQKVSQ
ncbi:XRE family transcriptional regulator [Lachnospiraceae bacterium]|nr:XRE family transcriptional regulator [Lachnospiraceae bacterium]